jgi:UDP-N-acetylglucosamine--N-acetylmuramyl-(pentapeptide) pyrophosphoryl-undecaprenol N-acetylglucosamine transferase
VRDIALQQQAAPYPSFERFNLLVFGGSQGAQFFGEFMPKVFAAMPEARPRRLRVTQQVRAENMER